MRKIQVPEPVDVLVSELLGSFGDNEASPECLDGAMRFLKRQLFSPVCYQMLLTTKQRTESQYLPHTPPTSLQYLRPSFIMSYF